MGLFSCMLRHDLRLLFHGWKTVVLLMLLPVGMLLTVAAALAPLRDNAAFIEPFPIALVDEEQSVWTAMLVRQLEGISLISGVVRVEEAEAVRLVREGLVTAAIVIPAEMSGHLGRMEPATVSLYGSSQFSLQSHLLLHVGQNGADIVSSGVATIESIRLTALRRGMPEQEVAKALDEVFTAFYARALTRRSVFAGEEDASMALSLVSYYGAGLMSVFLLFASLPCMKRLAADRRNGVHRRLRATLVPAWMPVLSLWIVSLIVSAMQFALLALVLSWGFHVWWGVSSFATFWLFLGTVMSATGFSMLVSSLADNEVMADVTGYLGVLVMAVAGGSLYPPTAMPDWVRPLSALTVTRWSREGFLGVFTGNVSEMGRSTGMLFLLTAVFLVSAVGVNRWRKGRA